MRGTFLLGIMLCGLIPSAATADQEGCSDAVDQYNSALGDVETTVRRYVNCIGSSQGKDDCSWAFARLRSAQSDFESAVSDISSECDD